MALSPERSFVRTVVEAGLLRAEQVDACLRERDAATSPGAAPRFVGLLLVERGLLAPEQIARLLAPGTDPASVPGDPPEPGPPRATPPPGDSASPAALAAPSTAPADGSRPAASARLRDARVTPPLPIPAIERSSAGSPSGAAGAAEPGTSSFSPAIERSTAGTKAPADVGPAEPARPTHAADPLAAMDDACASTADGIISLPEIHRYIGPLTPDAVTLTSASSGLSGPEPGADSVDATFEGAGGPPLAAVSGGLGQATGTFGRYQLIGEIARGAMGVVYRAFDPHLRRMVALKVMLSAEAPTPEQKRRFQKEALLAARVRHPNIVGVYEVGEAENKLYYTMELIDGESAQMILRKMRRIAPRISLKIARDCARALHAAHQQNLIHRDIKPANIMITSRERFRNEVAADDTWIQIGDKKTSSFRVLLTDFGIAKDVTSQTLMTRAGAVVGTPAYMSPEQAGEPEKMSPRSDIYSLGVVLYQCLCGQVPFNDPDPIRLLAAVIQREPPPLRTIAPDLHADLETIVHKAMMKDRARRYETAEAFADDIDRYLTGEMIRARPSSFFYRLWRKAVQHREIVVPLAAALLVTLAALFYVAAWPRIVAWRAERQAAAERLTRAADARARLGRAEGALAAGRPDDAAHEARDLVAAYETFGRRGEDVAQPEAQDLLARSIAARGESGHALLERYRAYRAALGSPSSERFLLGAARELVQLRRYDEALSLLARLTRVARAPEACAEAAYWTGRAREGVLDFAGARPHFARALAGYDLPVEFRNDAELHRKFCSSLARETPLELSSSMLIHADIDGDGRKEMLGTHANSVFAGTVSAGKFVERGRLALTPRGPYDLWPIQVVDLPDAAHPTIAVTGGDTARQAGGFHLVRWNGTALEESATAETLSQIGALGVVDVEGDGKSELLVGTVTPERALRVYDWDEPRKKLSLRAMVPVRGEVRAIHGVDFDGDGRREVVVFGAEWGLYGALVFRWDEKTQALAQVTHTHLGIVEGVIRIDRQDKSPRFVVGVGWQQAMSAPLRSLAGDAEFEKEYAPPGVYLLEPRPDFGFERKALVAKSWRGGDAGGATVMRLMGRAGDFLWVKFGGEGVSFGGPDSLPQAAILVYRNGSEMKEFAVLLPRPGSTIRLDGPLGVLDVDADGLDELLVSNGRTLTYFDAGEESAPEATAAPAGAGGPGDALPARDPLLDFALDAERVGLVEESLSGFREAALGARGLADLRDAELGALRCLIALGRAPEASVEAEEAAGRWPTLEVPLLEEAIRLLDQADAWSEAARLARRLLDAVDLTAQQRADLARRAELFSGLASMRRRTALFGVDSAGLDWVATSPLPFARAADGSWTVYAASGCADRLLVPFANPQESWRLTGRIETSRHDWAVGLAVGTGAIDPLGAHGIAAFYGLNLNAWGSNTLPVYQLDLRSEAPAGRSAEARLTERTKPFERPLEFAVTMAVHQESLSARVSGLEAEGEAVAERGALVCRGTLWTGVEITSSHEPQQWGVFRLSRLDLEGTSDLLAPTPFVPTTAAEHLLLANGRWVVGRPADALDLYGKSIALADLERAKEEAAEKAGLPSTWSRPSPNDVVRWCGVDARFYAALLHAAGGDAAAARAGIEEAWRMGPDRVRTLLTRYSLALRERPAETAVLREFWSGVGGSPTGQTLLQWGIHTYETIGPEALPLLVPGVELVKVTYLGVRKVVEGGAAHGAGLRQGDLIIAADGRPVGSGEELQATLASAKQSGRRDVVIEVVRQGRMAAFPVVPGDLGIEIQPVESLDIRLK